MATAVPVQDHPARRVCLGVIATAHGVRGLVKIRCYADDPQLLNGALFTSETGGEALTLTMKNSMGKYWLAEVDGVADRDAALGLHGTELWLGRDALPDIDDEDEFYLDDLVGLAAFDADGNPAGKIIAVENFGAGDLLEVQPVQGAAYYLAFTKENVPEVSIKDGKVTIAAGIPE